MPLEVYGNEVRLLLQRQPRTLVEDVGIDVAANDSNNLFCLLIAALLLSARIDHELAMRSATVIFKRGWTTPEKMVRSTWKERVKALDEGGYVRFDERTSTMLGDTAQLVIDKYKGDLRRLRDAATTEGRPDPARERKLLKEFKGVGDVGVNIFFREAQLVWPELYPFADDKILEAAKRLGLPQEPHRLAEFVHRKRDFVRLVNALMMVRLTHKEKEIKGLAA